LANALLSSGVLNPPSAVMAAMPSAATKTNQAAVDTLAPTESKDSVVASGVSWSYSAQPTGGNLLVKDGANTVYDVDIIAGGPDRIYFLIALRSTIGQSLTATLAAGGNSIVGKVRFLPGGEA
jgi:hypothetical protein